MTTTHLILRYIHITGGTLALLAGLGAMVLPKGSWGHRKVGNLFFVSMLMLSVAGVILASIKTQNAGNIMGGATAFYMVATAWATVIRPAGRVGRPERALAVLGGAGALAAATFGVLAATSSTGRFAGYPPLMYFIFAGIVGLAAALDVRMIQLGGLTGSARTTRHLWRMSIAFFMATGSFFFGQPRFVPLWMKETNLFIVAGLLPLALMIFWLIKIRLIPRVRRSLARRDDVAASGADRGSPRGAPI
jgi:hypothetical protein